MKIKITFTKFGIYNKIKCQYVGRNDRFPAASHFNYYSSSLEFTHTYSLLHPIYVIQAIKNILSNEIEDVTKKLL